MKVHNFGRYGTWVFCVVLVLLVILPTLLVTVEATVTVDAVNDRPVAGFGTALEFDGENDYVSIDPPNNMPTSSITIEAWIKLTAYAPWASIVDRNKADDFDAFSLGLDNIDGKKLTFMWANPGYAGWPNKIVANSMLPLGKWVHVAVSSDGLTATFYVNGMEDGTGSVGDLGTAGPIIIGANFPGGDEYFNGAIDEVRIWDTARTSVQIAANMDRIVAGSEAGLVGCWRFDENSGTTTFDQTGNHNDGTLVNGPAWITLASPVPLPQSINEGESTGAIAFTVGDVETPAGSLMVSGNSSNTKLIPNENIVFGGEGTNRKPCAAPSNRTDSDTGE